MSVLEALENCMRIVPLLLKRCLSSVIFPSSNWMNKTLKLSAAIVGATFQFPGLAGAWLAPSFRHLSTSRTLSVRYSSTSLQSTIKAEEEAVAAAAAASAPRTTAEGVVVSQFPGGLTAVRLNDDLSSESSPTVFDPSSAATSRAVSGVASGDLQGRTVSFPDGSKGVVVAHRPPIVFVYRSNSGSAPHSDGLVKVSDAIAMISVVPSEPLVDCFAFTTRREGALTRAMFAPIPQLKDIALINNPCLTGVTMIDTLAPIGQGQNMLFVGHDLEEMRGYTMDFLRTQIRDEKNTKCIYASTESRDLSIARLKEYGIERDVHLVAEHHTTTDHEVSRAAQAVAIAGAACAAGEAYALEKGINALVVVDTIDLHKKLWDATTRVLVDVFGVDAVVKADREGGASSEMRAFYSSLIQRAARYKESRGGGSVTLLLLTTIPRADANAEAVFADSDFDQAPDKIKERLNLLTQRNVPLTAANLRKIDIPIPTEGHRRLVLQHIDDLMSMSDGQIWLDERLESAGQLPPMDPQKSVTRIGIGADTESRADAPALRRVAERLRLDLSQASNMDGAEDTRVSRKQNQRRNALLLAMHQRAGTGGRKLSESCVALLAALGGHLDRMVGRKADAGTEEGEKAIQALFDHVLMTAASAMAEIDESKDLSPSSRSELSNAISSFFEE